ncbi:hypothetical protein EHS39_36290 [Ensifer sp. MPMI2T]|nr:hypothetical protein EHS39_36290 [Ensifer sp. MPMI2T]
MSEKRESRFPNIDFKVLDDVKKATELALPSLGVARQLHDSLNGLGSLGEAVRQLKLSLPGQEVAEAISRATSSYAVAFKSLDHLNRISELSAVLGDKNLLPATTLGSSYAELSRAVNEALTPIKLANSLRTGWDVSLASRLPAFDVRWTVPDLDMATSLYGFGSLARLSDAVHTAEPYAPDITEFVNEEIGDNFADEPVDDDAALDAGANPGFFAFREEHFPVVTYRAGFVFHLDRIRVPVLEDGRAFDGVFDPRHSAILTALEQCFRRIIVEDLQKHDGTGWTRKVPPALVAKWKEKQDNERALGRPVFEMIQYADFMDFADVISMKGNWNNCFSSRFSGREDLTVSLRRLHPIRNAMAHSRPIGKFDAVVLVTESSRLFIQLGMPAVDIIR